MPLVGSRDLIPLPDAPRVTVITMCKDRAWCIEECVRSVLAQDYPNIEYLVQDGASQDGTLDVLARYKGRLHLQSERDRGPMDAFHKGLARATGDLFCILLSDERFFDRSVVSRTVAAFREHPDAGAIYGDFRLVDAQYREIRVERKRPLAFEQIFCQEDFVSPCAAFVRIDTLRDNGQPRPDLRAFFDVIGDFGLWVYIGSRYRLQYVPGVIADFMVHGDEISHGLAHCRAYIRECETAIERFHTDAYTPADLAALKQHALARLYLNYSNALAGRYFREAIRLAIKGIRRRPRLLFSKIFLAMVLKSAGLSALLPARTDIRRELQVTP